MSGPPLDPRPLDPRPHLKDWSFDELSERCVEAGWPRYRAGQIAAWVYARGIDDPEEMSDLPAALRRDLAARWRLHSLDVAEVQRSVDGTIKARLRADDGEEIESVLIPEGDRITLCVSTQVGCPLACSFCATGALGFRRNLRVAEIIDQVCRMRALLPEGQAITNLVFMGMGEPLLNRAAVTRAIGLLQEPKGFAFGSRKITVSTAGVVPQIPKLLSEVDVNLAVSLHATTDGLRDELVPLNRSFPLDTLLGTLRSLPGLSRRHPVFFEYTLIHGKNDSPEDARRLIRVLRGIPAKVNLIPMNAHPDSPEGAPPEAVIEAFAGILLRGGLRATVRRPRGADIAAACGQLQAARSAARSVGAADAKSTEMNAQASSSAKQAARSAARSVGTADAKSKEMDAQASSSAKQAARSAARSVGAADAKSKEMDARVTNSSSGPVNETPEPPN